MNGMDCLFRGLHGWRRQGVVLACAVFWFCAIAAQGQAQTVNVTLHAEFTSVAGKARLPAAQPVAVAWLTPLGSESRLLPEPGKHTYRMVQKNKQFDPHVLVVPVGSMVQFPNHDPFFHNVFSLYNGKRFDLGLYETGSERGVRFDREGVSYIFCNIHPEMGAVIVALATPYYAVSVDGALTIPHVPPGKYALNVWSEVATPESMSAARKQVTVGSDEIDLGTVPLSATPSPLAHHANKFGGSYPASKETGSPGSPY
jgi:plastocyanin